MALSSLISAAPLAAEKSEGSFLVRKIHELHAQKREQRQAYQGRGMNEGAPPRTQ